MKSLLSRTGTRLGYQVDMIEAGAALRCEMERDGERLQLDFHPSFGDAWQWSILNLAKALLKNDRPGGARLVNINRLEPRPRSAMQDG
jgi:hypothetical protein